MGSVCVHDRSLVGKLQILFPKMQLVSLPLLIGNSSEISSRNS